MAIAVCRVHRVVNTAALLWSLDAELTPVQGGPWLALSLVPPVVSLTACLTDMASSMADEIEDYIADTFIYSSYYVSSIAGALVEAQFCAACLALRFWLWNLNCRIQVILFFVAYLQIANVFAFSFTFLNFLSIYYSFKIKLI